MSFLKRVDRWTAALGKKPGLMVLLGILVVIIATSIQPHQYFIGWDNYSSFFNLKTESLPDAVLIVASISRDRSAI